MEESVIKFSQEIAVGFVLLLEIIRLHFQHKTIKALTESSKTSNQRLDRIEKELRDKISS